MKEQLQHIFQNGYPGPDVFIDQVLRPIFSDDVITNIDIDIIDSPEKRRRADNANILSAIHIADIDRIDSDPIAFYDVTLSPGSNIAHSRVAIKQFIASEVMTFTHAFILFHYDNEPERPWRFSYVYKERTTAATRAVAKRYTYVFGKDYRSRTAVERFIALAKSPKTDEDFAKAFSVETLSDEFFDRYRDLYADFVQYITGKRYVKESGKLIEKKKHDANPQLVTSFEGNDKLVRDYIKKMFGRIVFLYFLQRKGWLAENRQYMHDLFYNSELQDNFLDAVLEPLFFGVLNTRPEHRSSEVASLPDSDKIPYLNGGLFQQDEIDERTCVLPADYFKRLFDFFDQYNFTIDENDPEDAEVGIDPEMLGRIFENLLEDNKDKGAFYTPKEIVEYMCRESILAYLLNGIPERSHELIRNFVETLDADSLNNEQRKYLAKKLVEVKICDPAIGSGAFPMGIVNILSKLYLALGLVRDRSKMKRHIMEQNIYGVDIEKGAVDIARLRFWLAMVVDAKEPEPLPNLHFKIMQGNSLLESYKGKDLSRLTEVNIGEPGSLGLQSEEAKSLVSSLGRFYNESDHNERRKILDDIIKNVQHQIYELTQSEDFMSDVKDISANDKFFLWHTWFADVFKNGGFDIVIGNPPYIQLQKSLGITAHDKNGKEYDVKLGDLYKHTHFATFEKTGDIYCLFYELGNMMLKQGGHLCYITSNKWMRAGYGKSLRAYLSKHTNPQVLIDFGGIQIFDSATVDTNILLFSKDGNLHKTTAISGSKQHKDILKNLSDFVRHNAVATDFDTSDSWVILSPIEQSIKRKIEAVGTPLKDWDIQINYGIKTGYNEAFIITTEKREEILSNCADEDERNRTDELIRPILRGRDIKRYGYDWADLWLINTHNGIKCKLDRIHIEDYPAVKAHLDQYWDKISTRADKGDTPYNLRNCAYLDDFNKPKLIWGEISDRSKFAYDSDGSYVPEATTFLLVGEEVMCLYSFLNSSPAEWYFSKLGPRTGEGTIRWKKYTVEMIFAPHLSHSQNMEIEDILSVSNTIINSHNINSWFYNFYGFTSDEQQYIEDYFNSIVKNK